MSYDHLRDLGWTPDLSSAFDDLDRPDLRPARVVAVHRGRVLVRGDGPDRLAPVAGALAHRDGLVPVAGDWVAAAEAVEHVLPRRGVLARAGEVLAAHVDLALAVSSLNRDLNLRRLERLLALARGGGAEALVVLTKGDLAADPVADAVAVADALGVEAIVLSALDGWGLQALQARLEPRRTTALLGMSGVGKSTLVNALLGEARQRTAEVRAGDDRGRHATTHRELFALPSGALLLDTPGVRAPGLAGDADVAGTFADVEALAARCRFADCAHEDEPGCAVQAALAGGDLDPARLRSMRKLEREAAREAAAEHERRAKGRQAQRHYRQVMRAKRAR